MAEAHSAVAFQFSVTDEGVAFHFDKTAVCNAASAIVHIGKNKLVKLKTAFLKGIFPATPLSLLVVTTGILTLYAMDVDPSFGLASLTAPIAEYVMICSLCDLYVCMYSACKTHCS